MPSLTLREAPGVLGAIVARTRADVTRRQGARTALPKRAASPPRSLADALGQSGLSLLAEFKPRAPSGGDLRDRDSVEAWLAQVATAPAAVSVLCDVPYFNGGLDLLARARAATALPVLCKDFIVDPWQIDEAHAAGADAVLLIVALLPPPTLRELRAHAEALGLSTLTEVHDERELAEAVGGGCPVIGVNSRDLRTLKTDLAPAVALLEQVPKDRVRVAESGLHTAADVDRVRASCDAVLIGTALSRAPDAGVAAAALGFRAQGAR